MNYWKKVRVIRCIHVIDRSLHIFVNFDRFFMIRSFNFWKYFFYRIAESIKRPLVMFRIIFPISFFSFFHFSPIEKVKTISDFLMVFLLKTRRICRTLQIVFYSWRQKTVTFFKRDHSWFGNKSHVIVFLLHSWITQKRHFPSFQSFCSLNDVLLHNTVCLQGLQFVFAMFLKNDYE